MADTVPVIVNGVPFNIDAGFASETPARQEEIKAEIARREFPAGSGTRLTIDEPSNESDIYNPDTAYTPGMIQEINKRAGQFASGINRDIAHTAGAPVDLMTGALNLGIGGINLAARQFGYGQKPQGLADLIAPNELPAPNLINPITDPFGGSASIERGMEKLGLLSPQPTDADPTGQYLQATGAGVGGAITGMGIGRGLRTAADLSQAVPRAAGTIEQLSRTPRVAPIVGRVGDTLSYGSRSVPGVAANTAVGAAGGAGGQAGTEAVSALTDDPTLRQMGGMTGNLVGGGLGATAITLANNAVRAGTRALMPLTGGGRRALAGQALREAAGLEGQQSNLYDNAGNQITGRDAQGNWIRTPIDQPLNAPLSVGQRLNNQGLLDLEKTVEQNVAPGERARFAEQRGAVNQTLAGNMERVGQIGADLNAASQTINTNLRANWERARVGQSTAHENIDPTNTIMFPTAGLKQDYKDAVDALAEARKPFVPTGRKSYGTILNNLDDFVPMRELTALRTMLGNAIRKARDAGEHDRANVLRDLDRALYQRVDPHLAPVGPHDEALLRYQEAQHLTRQWHQTFNEGDLGQIFETARGQPRVQPSAVAEHIFNSGAGQLERVNQFVSAANTNPATAPQTLQAGRDWFMTKFRQAATSAKEDVQGEGFLLGNKMRRFVEQNRGLIDSDLLTADQRALINEVVTTANMAERTARAGAPGASQTTSLLTSGNYLKDAIGGWVSQAVNAGLKIAAAAGGSVVNPAVGVVTGLATGPVVKNAYDNAAQKTLNLIAEGLRNPEMARDLMNSARQGIGKSELSPRILQLLAETEAMSAAVLPTTDRPSDAYSRAADMVNRLGPGEQVTRQMLEDATGISGIEQITRLRQELISKGLINREGMGMYRRSQPSSPNSGQRSEIEDTHPLRDQTYKAAQAKMPTLRGSTFNEIAQDIQSRESPLHGQYAPGGLYEQVANGYATHETMELAKRTRVFDPADWRVLAAKAGGWAKQFDIPQDLPAPVKRDEAIATAYNRWQSGEMPLPPGLRRIFSNYYDFSAGVA